MPSTMLRITIERPVDEVFAYTIDVDRLSDWNGVIEDSWMTSGDELKLGATYVVKAKMMGKIMEIPSEVVAYEPDRVFAYRVGGSMAYTDTKTFKATASGTLITERIESESDGFFSTLLSPILFAAMKRSHQKNLEQLKSNLEGANVTVFVEKRLVPKLAADDDR